MKRLNVAMVGCGWVAGSQIEDGFRHMPDLFHVSVACDVDEARVVAFAERNEVARTATTFDEILRMPQIDVVSICTPPHLHARLVIAALCAGKHVICEKPFAASLAEL